MIKLLVRSQYQSEEVVEHHVRRISATPDLVTIELENLRYEELKTTRLYFETKDFLKFAAEISKTMGALALDESYTWLQERD